VEDTAVVTPRGALIARPGAASRRGETAGVRAALSAYHPVLCEICAPGTLDGGDVLEAAGHYFIGLSTRTNKEGAGQLADWLADLGFSSTIVDVHGLRGLLHLKSGLAYLGGRRLAIVDSLSGFDEFSEWDLIRVPAGEEYAANCVRINERVLVAAGFPAFEAALREIELNVVTLDVSEFRKMDGGLSCLSIRF
jgi:dimethylargininase